MSMLHSTCPVRTAFSPLLWDQARLEVILRDSISRWEPSPIRCVRVAFALHRWTRQKRHEDYNVPKNYKSSLVTLHNNGKTVMVCANSEVPHYLRNKQKPAQPNVDLNKAFLVFRRPVESRKNHRIQSVELTQGTLKRHSIATP